MTSKGVLAVAGLIMITQGVLFLVFSSDITLFMFPDANEHGLLIGRQLRELIAGGSIFIGVILFVSRTNTTSAARRMLWAACFGFSLILLIQIKLYLLDGVDIHILPFTVFSGLALTSMFVASSR